MGHRSIPILCVLAFVLVHGSLAVKVVVGPGQTECVAEVVSDEHFQVRTGNSKLSQFYVRTCFCSSCLLATTRRFQEGHVSMGGCLCQGTVSTTFLSSAYGQVCDYAIIGSCMAQVLHMQGMHAMQTTMLRVQLCKQQKLHGHCVV